MKTTPVSASEIDPKLEKEREAIPPDYAKWRRELFKVNIIVAAAAFLIEVGIFVVLQSRNLIDQELPDYLFHYMLLPTALNFSAVAAEGIVLRYASKDSIFQNAIPILTLTIICAVIASAHYTFPNTMTIFCIPVMMSVVFCSKGLTIASCIMGEIGVLFAVLNRYWSKYPKSDKYLVPEVIISVLVILLAAYISRIVITLIKEQNEKILKATLEAKTAQQQALAASAAKSEFLANMSHEIRTPINAVLGMNEMILRESEDKTILEYAGNIAMAGNSLLTIINDVLDISKIESGRTEIFESSYALSSLINDSMSVISVRLKSKGLDAEVRCDPSLPSKLIGDEIRIRQIIVNLLTNAVKYSEKGTVVLSVGSEERDGCFILKISVKDNGIGISEEDQKKLFSQFVRVDIKHNRNIEGTGLGLALCERLTHLMKGTIEVHSKYGEGSEFCVSIPQGIDDSTPVGEVTMNYSAFDIAEKYKCSFTAPDAHILAVDDLPVNLKIITNLLKQTRLNIDTAESGAAAIELASQKKYDVILMDHMMPIMYGIEAARNIRRGSGSLNKDTPMIMLTANALSGVREQYLSEGFSDYISKPVKSSALESTIVKFLPPELVHLPSEEKPVPDEVPSDNVPSMESPSPKEDEKQKSPLEAFADSFPQLDLKSGLSYCCDNEEFYIDVLREYASGGKLEKMTELYESENFEEYCILAHSLKSTSLTLGLSELSERAKKSELAIKNNDIDTARENHHGLMEMYGEVLDRINKFLESI